MKTALPGKEPGQASQDRGAERDLRARRRAWRSQRALVPGEYARAIDLMDEVGQTETDVAATLEAMAEVGGSETRAQRLKLAEEAAKRAHDAAEHGVQLQRQAARWAEHADVVALCQSLHRAGRMLTDLAGAEKDLAATLMSVASGGGPDEAAQLRHLAEDARADARRANDRASSLRKLAASVVSSHHPPSHNA